MADPTAWAALRERLCGAGVTTAAGHFIERGRTQASRWFSRNEDVDVEFLHRAPDRWAVADAAGPLCWTDGRRALVRGDSGLIVTEHSRGDVPSALTAMLRPRTYGFCSDRDREIERQWHEQEERVRRTGLRPFVLLSGDPPPTLAELDMLNLRGPPKRYPLRAGPEPALHDGRRAWRVVLGPDGELELTVDDASGIVLRIAEDAYVAELLDLDLDADPPPELFDLGDLIL